MQVIEALGKGLSNPKRAGLKLIRVAGMDAQGWAADLIWNRLRDSNDEGFAKLVEQFSDDQARVHFGDHDPMEHELYRRAVRYFHAWIVQTLKARMGDTLLPATVVDVGDSDGMILKHLGKTGIGFNLSPDAIRNIEKNGIEAKLGDAQVLPFDDGEFDYVLCFETLEHVENPHHVLQELARICHDDGRIFLSIPWVPRTFIHPRDTNFPRGQMHIFEFCRKDFLSLCSHVPLTLKWSDVCWLFGRPTTLSQRLLLSMHLGDHIVCGVFRGFQFFELAPKSRALNGKA